MELQKGQARTGLDYLRRAQELGIEPNFWMSEDYFLFSGTKIREDYEWMWPETDGWALTPPILTNGGSDRIKRDWWSFILVPKVNVWSDWFSEKEPKDDPGGRLPEFLDWEYLYDPCCFLNLDQSKWAVLRKNLRKFPKRYGEPCYCEKIPSWNNLILELILEWSKVEGAKDGIQDEEVIVNYVTKGGRCKTLWAEGRLVGVNIWDSNYQYINFRYSFYDPGYAFLSEYLRWKFFTDPLIYNQGKMVNDGGTLGNEGLERFKDRLHPIRKRKVNSWRSHENQTVGI